MAPHSTCPSYNILEGFPELILASQTCSRQGQVKEFVNWTLVFFDGLRMTKGYQLEH